MAASDAGGGNVARSRSQAGGITFATSKRIRNKEAQRLSPIAWESHRQNRIAISALAAERIALNHSTGELMLVVALWAEMRFGKFWNSGLVARRV